MGIAAAGVSVAGGIAKSVMGAKQAKKAQSAIDAFVPQELTNAYAGMEVSTMGADLQREELARSSASSVAALQGGGVRALIGGIGSVQQQNVTQSRQIGADLDMQQKQIDQLAASDEARIQGIQEERDAAQLAGLGQQLAVGQQNLMSGIGDIAGAASSFAGGAMGGAGKKNPFGGAGDDASQFNSDYV